MLHVYLTFSESDWQVLLDLIRETASVCPEAFLATTQHSGGVPNKEHGQYRISLLSMFIATPPVRIVVVMCMTSNNVVALCFRIFLLSW